MNTLSSDKFPFIPLALFWIFLIVCTFLLPNAEAKGIYKCTKPNGEIEYTQSPSPDCQVKKIKNHGGKANQTAIDKLKADSQKADQFREDRQNKKLKEKDEKQFAKEMDEYCYDVKTNLSQLQASNRLYETDDEGNRRRLSEERRQERILESKENLSKHCQS